MDIDLGNTEDVPDNGSDSDVDVDDTGPTMPHLSSAQLLMQANKQVKPKTKLVIPKAKPVNSKLPSLVQTKPQPKCPTTPKSAPKQVQKQSLLTTKSMPSLTKTVPKQSVQSKQVFLL